MKPAPDSLCRREFIGHAGSAGVGLLALFDSFLSSPVLRAGTPAAAAPVSEGSQGGTGETYSIDQLHFLEPGSTRLHGFLHEKITRQLQLRFNAEDLQAMEDMFQKREGIFANGELWGKAVRAMVKAYRYQPVSQLKADLDATVAALLSTQTPDGCISSFPYEKQPYNADLWCRKYVLLGLEDYYLVTRDPKVLDAMIRMADYTLTQVGPAPKVRIINTGWAFEGIESSSILEPIVRLYLITGFSRYLAFARYIVEQEGACKRENIFEAVFRKDVRDIGSNNNPS